MALTEMPSFYDSGAPALNDAKALVKSLLERYNLGSEVDWAWSMLTQNRSPVEVALLLEERPAYRTRFAPIFERRQKGLAPISADEVVAYEQQAAQRMRAAGFPPAFVNDRELIHRAIVADVSVDEMGSRIEAYHEAVAMAPVEVRDYLRDVYGVGEGQLAAYYMDPDRTMTELQKQYAAAGAGAGAVRAGFGVLSQPEAERLGRLGGTADEMTASFGEIVRMRELFEPLNEGEDGFNRDEIVSLLEGSPETVRRLERRRQARVSVFGGGGQVAATERGVSGLSPATY
jgi:hypothetical protein